MKKNKLADAIGLAEEKFILEAAPKKYFSKGKNKIGKNKFISIGIAAAILTAAAVSTYAINTYIVQEKGDFGRDVIEADTDENFDYSAFDGSEETKEHYEQPDSCTTVNVVYEDPKMEIYHKMLNSIDYFNSVQLKMETSMLGEGVTTVEYQTNIDEGKSYQAVFSGDRLLNESFSESGNMIKVDSTKKTYMQNHSGVYSRDDTPYIPLSDRIETMEDGLPCYLYRKNVTNCPYASYCLVPQEITFSYLKDFDRWEIEATVKYLNRDCVKISGQAYGYIGEKHNADSFTMLVDAQTGVLMQFSAARDGNISRYMTVTECTFEADTDIKQFHAEDYSDFTEISCR